MKTVNKNEIKNKSQQNYNIFIYYIAQIKCLAWNTICTLSINMLRYKVYNRITAMRNVSPKPCFRHTNNYGKGNYRRKEWEQEIEINLREWERDLEEWKVHSLPLKLSRPIADGKVRILEVNYFWQKLGGKVICVIRIYFS